MPDVTAVMYVCSKHVPFVALLRVPRLCLYCLESTMPEDKDIRGHYTSKYVCIVFISILLLSLAPAHSLLCEIY